MQINKTDNVIFLKDVESNIIDEAFVILKDNVKLNVLKENEEYSQKNKTELDILKEAELLINQEINSNNMKYEKFKISRLERKIKILKTMNIINVIAFISYIVIK